MIELPLESRHLLFIGSPVLMSLTELQEKNVYLSDIPLYDVTRDMVLLNQQRVAEFEIRLQENVFYLSDSLRCTNMFIEIV